MATVYQMLRHRAVAGLAIIWTSEMIYEFGLPVDRFENVVIWEAELHEQWLLLLRRISSDIVFPSDVGQAAKAVVSLS